MDSSRILVYTRQDTPVGELALDDVFALKYTEELNGQHSMSITTTATLEKGWRVLTCDDTGKWREFVVTGIDEDHSDGLAVMGTYSAVWSLQDDLCGVTCDTMPGVHTEGGVLAAVAMESLLSHTARWNVGTVTCDTRSAASFYGKSAWEAMGILVENWGCEIDSEITVDNDSIVTRAVAVLEHTGHSSAVRRFDWTYDLTRIRRKVAEAPIYARIIPLGKGEELEGGGYGRRITIETVNSGVKWLQNNDVAEYMKMPDGQGGWEYPTTNVLFDDITDPQTLKDTALAAIDEYTVPRVTYSADVAQFAAAGMDSKGVALGDEVQCVDMGFGTNGVRISGRVVKIIRNGLDKSDIKLTIGNISEGVSNYFQSVNKRFEQAQDKLRSLDSTTTTTAQYLTNIIDNINQEINSTGGYWYITPGQGVRTYDTEVSDPLIGAEANAVTEMRGGTLRFANSRTAQGEWDWKTILVSGHIATELVTAAQLTAGYIGSPSGNYWNLDTGELKMSTNAKVGNQTLAEYISDVAPEVALNQTNVFNALTNNGAAQGMFIQNGQLYINATYLRTGIIQDAANKNYWNMQTGEFKLSPTTEIGDTTASDVVAKANAQVGGTNLLMDSDAKSLTKIAATANRVFSGNGGATNTFITLNTTNRPVSGITNGIQSKFAASKSGKYMAYSFYNGASVSMIDGQQYTISCWARSTAGKADVQFQYGQTHYKASAKMAIGTKWSRYSWTFTFSQSAAGGSNGARVYFITHPTTAAAMTMQMCGFKLEIGAKATDWAPSPEDTSHSITKESQDMSKALNDSLEQGKLFNRLTRNGTVKGIILKNGQLYINANYINSGTLKADVMRAGVLSDKLGKSKWDLTKGTFETESSTFKNCTINGYLQSFTDAQKTHGVKFSWGDLEFFINREKTLYINGKRRNSQRNQLDEGAIVAKYALHIDTPKILVSRDANSGKQGVTKYIEVIIPASTGGKWNASKPTFKRLRLEFLNGICIRCDLI